MYSVGKAKKKPVVVDFVLWSGDNWVEVFSFMGCIDASYSEDSKIVIHTLEGDMYADEGDYIIKGVQGEFYPCKPDIFLATYDIIDEVKTMSYTEYCKIMQNKWTFTDIEEFNEAIYEDSGVISKNFIDYCVEKGYYEEK